MLAEHLGKPLTQVPDPFGEYPSFGHHNNARLRAFLDTFGFDYEFLSATECYTSGRFDKTLLKVLGHYDAMRDVILPTLGPERRATYSPFLPISPNTGQVLQVPIVDRDLRPGPIIYKDPDTGKLTQVPVTGGRCKLQWKADWAMRWAALGVDYEMAGKDLIDWSSSRDISAAFSARSRRKASTTSSSSTRRARKFPSRAATGSPSRSGWLTPAPRVSLYMFQSPRKAKRLYFDVIRARSTNMSDILPPTERRAGGEAMNPVWHIHEGQPPEAELPISFALLLNLARASNSEDREVLWGFIRRYAPDATPEAHPLLDQLVSYAIRYFHDFVKPAKRYRAASEKERAALLDLEARLAKLTEACWPRRSSPRFMPSARSMASSRCATGSRRFTRCCSARRKARASAPSSSSTASARPAR